MGINSLETTLGMPHRQNNLDVGTCFLLASYRFLHTVFIRIDVPSYKEAPPVFGYFLACSYHASDVVRCRFLF